MLRWRILNQLEQFPICFRSGWWFSQFCPLGNGKGKSITSGDWLNNLQWLQQEQRNGWVRGLVRLWSSPLCWGVCRRLRQDAGQRLRHGEWPGGGRLWVLREEPAIFEVGDKLPSWVRIPMRRGRIVHTGRWREVRNFVQICAISLSREGGLTWVQGGPYASGKKYVDIKFKVPLVAWVRGKTCS